MTVTRQFDFVFNELCDAKFQQHYSIKIWCDGRRYDSESESYRPVYSYSIAAINGEWEWEYTSNDLFGLPNTTPNLAHGAKSLVAFLVACQEGLPEDTEGKSDNAYLFPPHVREFAYLCKEKLEQTYMQLFKEVEGICPDQ